MFENSNNLAIVDSEVLCEYISCKCGKMSHLKLQKLLYYVQAYHLAYFDAPLIEDDFEAWVHGPVSRKIYNQLKDISTLYTELYYNHTEGAGKPHPNQVVESKLTKDQFELLNNVLVEFSKLSALQLENLTHSEPPWQNARKGIAPSDPCKNIIPKGEMANYYKKDLYGG